MEFNNWNFLVTTTSSTYVNINITRKVGNILIIFLIEILKLQNLKLFKMYDKLSIFNLYYLNGQK